MFISGFTFIKDAIIYDYPIVEAINSILPICDEVVVAVGKSTDETLELIKNIHPIKIKIIETQWDESLREGGKVLAIETDKAFKAIDPKCDWAFYIQGDEVVHEKYLPEIKKAMLDNLENKNIDGLLFHYKHFYGSYDYVGDSSNWYPYEIRVIRNNNIIFSYKDAQGFRKNENEKLNVKLIDAFIYHYGWVKEPKAMQKKQLNFNKYWHDDAWVEKNVLEAEAFDYSKINSLTLFKETHPAIMQKRIAEKNWQFKMDLSFNQKSFKEKLKLFLKKYLGLDFNYKNYRIVK
ncbi:MAG: glycosyltransferase family 2 protein [Chitinophagaceae bacterium]|nr:glycosyltransferase family 2 protein [Chitinophagaceae bacterium]